MIVSIIGTRGGIGATTLLSNLYSYFKTKDKSSVWFSLTDPFPPIFSGTNPEWEKLHSFSRYFPEWQNDNCSGCNSCVSVCVNEAIAPFPDKYVVYTELCNSCKACISACKCGGLDFKASETGYIKKIVSHEDTLLKIKLFGREILSQWYVKEAISYLKKNYQSESFHFIDVPSGFRELWPDVFRLSDIVIILTDDTFLWDLLFKSHSPRHASLILAVTQNSRLEFINHGYSYAISIPYNKEITRTTIQGFPSQDFDFMDALRSIYLQIKVAEPHERNTSNIR
jgi:MinD superfamily P-loop ATPase